MLGGREQLPWGWKQVGSGGLNKPQDPKKLALAIVHANAFAWPPMWGPDPPYSPTDSTPPPTPKTPGIRCYRGCDISQTSF